MLLINKKIVINQNMKSLSLLVGTTIEIFNPDIQEKQKQIDL